MLWAQLCCCDPSLQRLHLCVQLLFLWTTTCFNSGDAARTDQVASSLRLHSELFRLRAVEYCPPRRRALLDMLHYVSRAGVLTQQLARRCRPPGPTYAPSLVAWQCIASHAVVEGNKSDDRRSIRGERCEIAAVAAPIVAAAPAKFSFDRTPRRTGFGCIARHRALTITGGSHSVTPTPHPRPRGAPNWTKSGPCREGVESKLTDTPPLFPLSCVSCAGRLPSFD